jgi:hypothetical protein
MLQVVLATAYCLKSFNEPVHPLIMYILRALVASAYSAATIAIGLYLPIDITVCTLVALVTMYCTYSQLQWLLSPKMLQLYDIPVYNPLAISA